MSFILATDSSCDLDYNYLEKEKVHIFKIIIEKDGESFEDDLGISSYHHKDLYNKLRQGSNVKTSLPSPEIFKAFFIKCAKENHPVLYIALSSGGSGTYQAAVIAKNEVLESFPNAKIYIIDSLGGSGGIGVLVKKAIMARNTSESIEDVVCMIEKMKNNVMHLLTVNDLMHLSRGGRLPQIYAVIGEIIKLKPVLYITEEGTLELLKKVRGRKNALNLMINYFSSCLLDPEEPVVITHTDCEEEAFQLADKLKESFGLTDVTVSMGHASMGVHTGPDTIGLYFLSKQKEPKNK